MKNKRISIVSLLILLGTTVLSQEQELSISSWRIGVELGTHYLSYDRVIPSQVRSIVQSNIYQYSYSSSYYSADMWGSSNIGVTYVSIKPEYLLTERLSVSSGIRFSFYNDMLTDNGNYFLWELPGDANTANYLRVRNIEQSVYTLGLPVEFRFSPRRVDGVVRHYFVAGGLFNFATFTRTKVNTLNPSMNKYEEQVKEQLPRPTHFSNHFYAGMGLKIGKIDRPFVNVEVLFPMFSFGNSVASSFAHSVNVGTIGISTSFKVPIRL